jgi:hypothetical protein
MTYAHPFNGIDGLFHIKDKKANFNIHLKCQGGKICHQCTLIDD